MSLDSVVDRFLVRRAVDSVLRRGHPERVVSLWSCEVGRSKERKGVLE
jgi:hypothetical protein